MAIEDGKRIDQFNPKVLIAQDDLVPFWKTGSAETCQIPFSDFMKNVRADLAIDGIVGKIESNYYRFKPDNQGVWIIVEDLGTTYPS